MPHKKLFDLALERIIQLGQEAFSLHEDLERWREKPFESGERTTICVSIRRKMEEQREWAESLQTILEDTA